MELGRRRRVARRVAVGRIKGRCSFELSRRGTRGFDGGNGAMVGRTGLHGGSNGAGGPEVGGWRCSWVEATTSKSDFRSTCYASGSLACLPASPPSFPTPLSATSQPVIRLSLFLTDSAATVVSSSIHLSRSSIQLACPRLWHTLPHKPRCISSYIGCRNFDELSPVCVSIFARPGSAGRRSRRRSADARQGVAVSQSFGEK